ncbi:hypothetical protein ACOSP7_013924 [Xanthoceras sorbifolium]
MLDGNKPRTERKGCSYASNLGSGAPRLDGRRSGRRGLTEKIWSLRGAVGRERVSCEVRLGLKNRASTGGSTLAHSFCSDFDGSTPVHNFGSNSSSGSSSKSLN